MSPARLGAPPTGLVLSLLLVSLLSGRSFASDCGGTSTGLIPLNDLGPDLYLGQPGGLYPGGSNTRPAAHDAAGLLQAAQVVPRNASGQPQANGRIVMASIGFSNATQEFSVFKQLSDQDPLRNPRVQLIDAAQGGQAAEDMVDPAAPYWSFVQQRIQQAGATAAQVQVIWFKNANRSPTDPFPQHALNLTDQFVQIMRNVRALFPNARLAYLGARTYAGYADTPLNPEPWAYEQGFAVKWAIERQIDGDPLLVFDAPGGPPAAPWLAFASYNWTDGLSPRSDGLIWECSDTAQDGTHPSTSGRMKVAQLLLDFAQTDATTKSWYLHSPSTPCAGQASDMRYGTPSGGPNGVPRLVASGPLTVPTARPVRLQGYGAPAAALSVFLFGWSPLPDGQVPLRGGSLLVQPADLFLASTDVWGKSSLVLGAVPDDAALCGTVGFFQFLAEDPDSAFGWDVSQGLRVQVGH